MGWVGEGGEKGWEGWGKKRMGGKGGRKGWYGEGVGGTNFRGVVIGIFTLYSRPDMAMQEARNYHLSVWYNGIVHKSVYSIGKLTSQGANQHLYVQG